MAPESPVIEVEWRKGSRRGLGGKRVGEPALKGGCGGSKIGRISVIKEDGTGTPRRGKQKESLNDQGKKGGWKKRRVQGERWEGTENRWKLELGAKKERENPRAAALTGEKAKR